MRIPSEVHLVLRQRVKHEEKITLLQALLQKMPEQTVIHDFIQAEQLLIRKKGMLAAQLYGEIAYRFGEPSWLLERQAKTYAKYAYTDIGSGPINKAFDIYTQKLGVDEEKAWKKIGDILTAMKGFGYAAQCYANAGQAKKSGKIFEKNTKDPQRAGFYYEQAEEWLPAARAYKKAKLHDKAGECYAKAGYLKLAVQQWKKAGTLERHNVGPQTMENILRK
ncbi:soluble NSF attachment family protein [Candidatus Woesearchaeota archaeon]|nr:soluble NSF attachment family protein [Candidatus Woesearchaeota archaeon]